MAQKASPATIDASLAARLEGAIGVLGLDGAPGLVRSWEAFDSTTSRHIVRQAFETVGAQAVFGFRSAAIDGSRNFTPILYLCTAADDTEARNIHRLVWSQGVVPLLLVATPSGLQVRRSLAPPPEQPIGVPWQKLEGGQSLPVELTSLSATALRSSVVWRDFAIDRSSRVDKALLEGIVSLSNTVQERYPTLDRATTHAVIGRFLYLYVLLDRCIIDAAWIGSLKSPAGRALCPSIASSFGEETPSFNIAWPAREVWALFDAIDDVMNGAIFPIPKVRRRDVSDEALHLVDRVIRHGDRVGPAGHQLSFLDVSFSTLRTETISAIYELFLALESAETKSDEGAFYTPPFLVDYVLDQTDRIEPFSKASRVLDPAAGSGIFLVGAYRRMLERSLPTGNWGVRHFRESRKLLEQNVFGIERNAQAANVCRFSLYLTLLDYIAGANITALGKMAKGDRVFPPLTDNIVSRDVFDVPAEGAGAIGRFTHVVGNPPWGSFGDSASRTNEQRSRERQDKIAQSMAAAVQYHASLDPREYPVSNKRLSELFVWKIKRDHLVPNGTLGILISTKSFVSRTASAFPNALTQQLCIVGVANLSHFRYRLFAEARSPTIAVFARNGISSPLDEIWVYSPLLSSQPIGETGHLWSIIVNSVDVETHRLRDLVRNPEGWFDHLILRPLDRRYARHLKAWTERTSGSLGAFLLATGLRSSRGGSPTQTGLPDRLLLKANYRQILGLGGLGFGSYPHDELAQYDIEPGFRRLFSGNVLLIPRSMNAAEFVERPIGFSSTFNAIYFPQGRVGPAEKRLLTAIGKFLMSDVASYFYALVGKSWILDHARLEKNDLEAIPFPIKGLDDDAIGTLLAADQKTMTALVANRLGLDRAFVDAVDEYVSFRSGYEDSQLPPRSLEGPGDNDLARYQVMLSAQLTQSFGSQSAAAVELQGRQGDGYFALLVVHFTRRGENSADNSSKQALPAESLAQFSPYSAISYDASDNRVAIVKPWTHVAWTIEQAFADARGVSAAVLRAGVVA